MTIHAGVQVWKSWDFLGSFFQTDVWLCEAIFSEISLLNWLNTFVVCSIFCRCFVWAILLAVIGFVWHFGCRYSILSTFGKHKACLIFYELLTQRVKSDQFKLYQHSFWCIFKVSISAARGAEATTWQWANLFRIWSVWMPATRSAALTPWIVFGWYTQSYQSLENNHLCSRI